jgi:hypothetical protein
LFLCFSTRRESEESIFDGIGSLERLIKNSDNNSFFQNTLF